MRKNLICTSVVVSLILISAMAEATDIKTKEYGYGYGDSVKSMSADTFAVCGDCTNSKLGKAPTVDYVAVKYNAPLTANEVEPHWPSTKRDPVPLSPHEEAISNASPVKPAVIETHLGGVHFAFDSDKLTESEKGKLDKIAASTPVGVELSVFGYTCAIGSKNYNLDLSSRRARAVADYLGNKGVKIRLVKGMGESESVSETNKKLNRRVEFTQKEKI